MFPEIIQNADVAAVRFIREYIACPVLDFIMPYVTLLGDKGIFCIVVAIVLIIVNKGKSRKAGTVMLCAIVMGFLVGNLAIKPLVHRARPCWIDSGITLLIENPHDYSFPSGHTLVCFETAVPVCMYFGKKWGAFAIVIACLVAFSRLYLYVHFPTDILAGALLGTAFVLVARFLTEKAYAKVKLSKEKNSR